MPRDETFADSRAYVMQYAPESFAQHVLTQRSEWAWKVARPDSWFYGYFLLVSPGAVIIYGDIGEAIFRMNAGSETEVLDWILRCSSDHHYTMSKLANREAYRRFYPGDALAYAQRTGHEGLIDDLRQAAEDELTAERFYRLCWDHDQYDMPSCTDWAPSAFWFAQALVRFATLREKVQPS